MRRIAEGERQLELKEEEEQRGSKTIGDKNKEHWQQEKDEEVE